MSDSLPHPAPAASSREQLAALLEVSHLLTSSTDLDTLLHLILNTVTRLFQADGSSLLLVDPFSQELVFYMPFDRDPEQVKAIRLKPGQGVAGWVAAHRRPLLVNDAPRDPRFFSKVDTSTGFRTESILAAPLPDGDRILGVIEVLNTKKNKRFEPQDLDLLTAFAVSASVALRNAQLVSTIRAEKDYLQEALEARYRTVIGKSAAMQAAVKTARKAAASSATVLLLGESGTGKEILARSIHAWSPRTSKPFRAVNCVALSDHLLESELFGHEKGAFTGAITQKKGLFELAHGGTIFLDEVGDMKPDLQAKLLRVLQEREFERVGGTQSIKVDVRVIAATNQDLDAAVRAGRFRKDLFYRLNVIAVTLPPLRERKDDIPALAQFFLDRSCREMNRSLTLSPEATALLLRYDWPGNVRELDNVIERAVVLSSGGTLEPEDFPLDRGDGAAAGREPESLPDLPFYEALDAHKRALLLHALARAGGKKSQAAKLLKLNPTHFSRLCRQHKIV
jgi:Nif-specific regulatory protein